MSNRFYSTVSPTSPDTPSLLMGPHGASDEKFPEVTASWGGLPGKEQPKGRSDGVDRLKIYPKSAGL